MLFYIPFLICSGGLLLCEWVERKKDERFFSIYKTCLWFSYLVLLFFRFLYIITHPGPNPYEFILWAIALTLVCGVVCFHCYPKTSHKNHDFIMKMYIPLTFLGFVLLKYNLYFSFFVLFHYLLVVYRGNKTFWIKEK